MDRRMRKQLAMCGLSLGLAITATGCRNLRTPEVPPDPPYYPAGTQAPPTVGFSSDPAPANAYGGVMPGTMPDAGSYGASPFDVNQLPPNDSSSYGAPAYSPAVPGPEPLQSLPGLDSAGIDSIAPPADLGGMPPY